MCKGNRKRSQGRRQRYEEKISVWECGACGSSNTAEEAYCAQCYQHLYYYCYVNSNLFVEKDQAYLALYGYQRQDSLSSESDVSSDSDSDLQFQWLQTLLE